MPQTRDTDTATGWFVGAIVALAIGAISYLVFTDDARASDMPAIEAGTFLLHENGTPICTAQAVNTDDGLLLLTAKHCVEDKEAQYSVNRVTFDEAKFDRKVFEAAYFVNVVRRDKSADVAVLRPFDKTLDLPAVDLATVDEAKAVRKGDDVLVAGYPSTQNASIGDLVFTEGLFVGLSKAYEPSIDGTFYRTTASVHYGNSGGGLYAKIDDTWKLVGITSQLDTARMWVGSLFANRDAIEKNIRLTPKPATDK